MLHIGNNKYENQIINYAHTVNNIYENQINYANTDSLTFFMYLSFCVRAR